MRLPILVIAGILALPSLGHTTTYFNFYADSIADGSVLTNPPFCGWQCGGGPDLGIRGYVGSSGGTPQGSKYIFWNISQNQHDFYNEIRPTTGLPIPGNQSGRTFYLAFWFRFERKTGGNRFDVFQSGNLQSAEKGFEIRGPGLRWITAMGQWDSLASNSSGRFTVWLGNPSHHLNTTLEHNDVYYPNQGGFTENNSQQLEYEKWHSVVFAVKLATTATGAATLWVNGVKTFDYQNIFTVAPGTSTPTVEYLELGGTLCQPAYDCPPHVRKYDGILLTDTWQDIVNGGYLAAVAPNRISPPTGLRFSN